jgi:hypothetical protein
MNEMRAGGLVSVDAAVQLDGECTAECGISQIYFCDVFLEVFF